MLREGLAAEFPSAKRAFARAVDAVRAVRVSREAPVWAAVSAFGAMWAVSAIGQPIATVLRVAGLRDAASWLAGGVAVVGYAVAIAVAVRAGGRSGVAWYGAILSLRLLVQLATSLPGFFTFCERGGDCSLLRLVTPYAYLAAGIVVSAIPIRVLRAGREGPNAFLNGAGALSLLTSLTGIAYFVAQPQDSVGASAISFALNGAAAFGAGVALRLRTRRRLPMALLAGSLVLSWLALAGPFVWSALASSGAPEPAALYFSGLTDVLALVLGWLVGAAQRARTTAAA